MIPPVWNVIALLMIIAVTTVYEGQNVCPAAKVTYVAERVTERMGLIVLLTVKREDYIRPNVSTVYHCVFVMVQ